jgi:hypothetical protein
VREPVPIRGLQDEASRKPAIECIERVRLLQLADGRELIGGELLAEDRGPLQTGS